MPFNADGTDKNKAVSTAMGAAIATAVATSAAQVGTMIYEKITGNTYSKSDKERLNELKRLYQRSFQITAPIYWDLDDKDRPTHCIKNQKWLLYIRQLKQFKGLVGHYHYQSHLIAEYAVTYLIDRGQRWFGKGKPGDLIEQFFGEWINFSLNDLPTFGYDQLSINKIKNRLAYLEQIQKHEKLFKHGSITRSKNKSDVIECIKKQLRACLSIASQESLRQCAREKFDCCRNDLTALLLSCVQTIYYARVTPVDCEPFELEAYLGLPDKVLTESAKSLYPTIKETHTGAMLVEIVSLSGLDAFGCVGKHINLPGTLNYYNTEGSKKTVDWQSLNHDLPKWVEETEKTQRLNEFHHFGESILRVARLKKLIEIAYDLTGKVGDLWAYGDKRGKLSLQALIFLLDKEVKLLKKHYDDLYTFHNTQRHAYNLKNRVNPDKGSNPNFNKVDDQRCHIEDRYASIHAAIQSLHDQLVQYPEDAHKQIDAKKEEFYQSLSRYLKQFYPAIYPQYQLLEKKEKPSKANYLEENIDSPNEITMIWPLKTHPHCATYLYLDKPPFHTYFNRTPSKHLEKRKLHWKLGNQYTDWVTFYFSYHSKQFNSFQDTLKLLQNEAKKFTSLQRIASLSVELHKIIGSLKQNVELERPRWRFTMNLWPILTWGWPFHRRAIKFANQVLIELDTTSTKVSAFLKLAQKKLSTSAPRDTTADTASLVKALSNQASMIDQRTKENEAHLKIIEEKDKKLKESALNAQEWFTDMHTQFLNWQKQQTPLTIFNKHDDPNQFLLKILEFRDQLSSDLYVTFIKTWEDYLFTINLEIAYPEELDKHTHAQLLLILKLGDLLKSAPNSDNRKKLEKEFVDHFHNIFSNQNQEARNNNTNQPNQFFCRPNMMQGT